MMNRPKQCALCHRKVSFLTRHHLIPRTRHSNKKNKALFDREEVKKRVAWLCSACHENVHAILTEKELERNYNTIEQLAGHPRVKTFTEWIRNKPETSGIRVKTSRRLKKS